MGFSMGLDSYTKSSSESEEWTSSTAEATLAAKISALVFPCCESWDLPFFFLDLTSCDFLSLRELEPEPSCGPPDNATVELTDPP